jgi:acetyl-CoA carboxylase biotin carboxyl carrier protein
MSLTPTDLQVLLAAFDDSTWSELTLTLGGDRVVLSKTGRPPATVPHDPTPGPPPVPAALAAAGGARLPAPVGAGAVGSPADVAPVPAVEAAERQSELLLEDTSHLHRVLAPSVGVFWRSPEPSAPAFVEVGQRVEPDDPVCIVEVMKLFNHVPAGVRGTVQAVEVDNAAMVEHGQTLFLIDVDG